MSKKSLGKLYEKDAAYDAALAAYNEGIAAAKWGSLPNTNYESIDYCVSAAVFDYNRGWKIVTRGLRIIYTIKTITLSCTIRW